MAAGLPRGLQETTRMKPVDRESLLDYVTYEEQREAIRTRVLEVKRVRRVHVGGVLTFLFENADTIRYQVQEMMRAERIVRESDVQRELDTYNELLGGPGELGCTVLIEIDDPAERDRSLTQWLDLPERLYVRLEDGRQVRASFDPRQVGEGRLSSVQYVRFDTGGGLPVAVGVDAAGLEAEAALDPAQREALALDLRSDRPGAG